jgi:hypothetical protein
MASEDGADWTRIFYRRNPVGLWTGITLLLVSAILAAAIVQAVMRESGNMHAVVFGRDASIVHRVAFFGSVGAAIVGAFLVHRWYKATHRWPYS